ncbi:hypothetical protein BY996DRAFT_3337909 [Phakopsora pachyrhizi]|nr:hypothetical protein BY996DRAFT_3337909 [Phakopsora pachyrhizi]
MTTTSRVRQPSASKLDLRSSVISSSSTSDDFREYVGCSNCARDLVSNERKAKGHQRTTFWIFECGHISCAFCLGISDGIPDFGSEHTCPLPSCGESPSAIHQLTLGAPIHPTLSPFFESPRPQIERLKSNLGFQNLQMSLRIKNLRKLVEILQDSMMEAKSQLKDMRASKQEVMALKHEVRHLRKIIGDSQHGQSNLLHQFKDQNQDQSNPFDRATGLSEPVTAFDTRLQPEFQRPTISPLGNRRLSVPSNHPYLVKASEINSRRKTSSNSLWSHEQSVSAQNPDAKRKISPEHIRQYEFSSKKLQDSSVSSNI